ncbi:transcriptional regulator, AbrB family [Tepidimonas sediminis]|uniref:Transcriptional regulator, AbrB family n=2 Tax=Tepidimonas sediminis TaxID=2588941 RepID=A0A554WUU4_9BURK|nr:transcriptional regulator, AbrB family [Tepidimonas sediminis]
MPSWRRPSRRGKARRARSSDIRESRTIALAQVTSKGQTTIPAEIRAVLHVSPGDLIAWELEPDGSARVRRVQPLDLDYLKAVEGTLSEWMSPADEEAYRDL